MAYRDGPVRRPFLRRRYLTGERSLGSATCECTECGTVVAHRERGVPCAELDCPLCGTPLTGEYCTID